MQEIKVFNILGLEVRSYYSDGYTTTDVYDMSDLAIGMYFVKLIADDDSVLATRSFSKVD